MKLEDRIEDTLGGLWAGLQGEVVAEDCYGLRSLRFVPDVVFDVGANVGTFTRFARSLWPETKIIAVEPDPLNCAHFNKFSLDPKTKLIPAAIGLGFVFHATTAANGSGEVYMSPGLGYPTEKLIKDPNFEGSSVPAITLEEVILPNWKPGQKAVLKIDCEGAENSIWTHLGSMKALQSMDYVAIELHRYAADGAEQASVDEATFKALSKIRATHAWVSLEGVHFHARKEL